MLRLNGPKNNSKINSYNICKETCKSFLFKRFIVTESLSRSPVYKVIEDKDILFLTKRIFKNSFKYFFFHIII